MTSFKMSFAHCFCDAASFLSCDGSSDCFSGIFILELSLLTLVSSEYSLNQTISISKYLHFMRPLGASKRAQNLFNKTKNTLFKKPSVDMR